MMEPFKDLGSSEKDLLVFLLLALLGRLGGGDAGHDLNNDSCLFTGLVPAFEHPLGLPVAVQGHVLLDQELVRLVEVHHIVRVARIGN